MMDSCGKQVTSAPLAIDRPWSPQRRDPEPLMPIDNGSFSCLSEVELFADLSREEILAMDRMAPSRSYSLGELVFSQSQPVTALFILKKGRIRIFRVTEDGKALTMAILEPGAVFGEMMMVGQRMYDNYAEAIDDVDICLLNTADVERYLLADPRIAIRISRHLGEQVVRLEERLTDLALRPLQSRVCSTLLRLAETSRTPRFASPTIRLSHDQLAGLLGATRESTSKAMSDLASRGIIRQGRARVVILDVDALGQLARQSS
jgi:CRP/FNR family transcriptional regulator